MTKQEAIPILEKMAVEAHRHLSIAIREHHWSDTRDKWEKREQALDAAIAALR